PIQKKSGDEGVSDFEAKWFSKHLARMEEPRLPSAAADRSATIYRFTILPTWGNPIAVRVQKHDGLYSLAARRLDGQGGYDPGTVGERKDLELSKEDSESFDRLLSELKFFELPSDDGVMGFDGDEWILEGIAQGKYHVIRRWTAKYNTEKRGL